MEKAVKILNIKDKQTDYEFWQSRTFLERIEAVELLRLQFMNFNKDVQPRLQRVCSIINKA